MRTIERSIYSYDELSDKAKEKVKELFYSWVNLGDFWEGCIIERLERYGYESPKLRYSLSGCQGDGLSFSCEGYDIKRIEKILISILGKSKAKTAKLIAENIAFEYKGNQIGYYAYHQASQVHVYFDFISPILDVEYNNIDSVVKQLLERLQSMYINTCVMLEKEGYNEIEYQTSDEYIKEYCEDNNYEFYKDGKLF